MFLFNSVVNSLTFQENTFKINPSFTQFLLSEILVVGTKTWHLSLRIYFSCIINRTQRQMQEHKSRTSCWNSGHLWRVQSSTPQFSSSVAKKSFADVLHISSKFNSYLDLPSLSISPANVPINTLQKSFQLGGPLQNWNWIQYTYPIRAIKLS